MNIKIIPIGDYANQALRKIKIKDVDCKNGFHFVKGLDNYQKGYKLNLMAGRISGISLKDRKKMFYQENNCISFDSNIFENNQLLYRIKFKSHSYKYLRSPLIPGRFLELKNKFNFPYNRNWIINKKGIIVIALHTSNGWYKDGLTIKNLEPLLIKIKNNTSLEIQIRLHPVDREGIKIKRPNMKAHKKILDQILKKFPIKLNNDPLEKMFKKTYCVIADKSSIIVSSILHGIPVFNFQKDYEHSCIGNLGLRDLKLLNPENLNLEKLKNRDKYLDFMASHTWTPEEMLKGIPQKYYCKYLGGETEILKKISEVI